jgi:hypothetical protein
VDRRSDLGEQHAERSTDEWRAVPTAGSPTEFVTGIVDSPARGRGWLRVGVLTHVSVGVRPDVSVPAGRSYRARTVRRWRPAPMRPAYPRRELVDAYARAQRIYEPPGMIHYQQATR